MKAMTLEGRWDQVRGKVKERWGKLTDDDIKQIEGKREKLEGKIKERYGFQEEEARKQVAQFAQDCGC